MCVCFDAKCYSGATFFFPVALSKDTPVPQNSEGTADPPGSPVLPDRVMHQVFQLYSWTLCWPDVVISKDVIKTIIYHWDVSYCAILCTSSPDLLA